MIEKWCGTCNNTLPFTGFRMGSRKFISCEDKAARRTKAIRGVSLTDAREIERKFAIGFARRGAPENLGPTKEFPGVDIDAVHYKLRAIASNKRKG